MKVKDLIEILDGMNPEAEVRIMSQKNWPFENSIYGVFARGEFEDAGNDEDVFIVEGEQLTYGNSAAWL